MANEFYGNGQFYANRPSMQQVASSVPVQVANDEAAKTQYVAPGSFGVFFDAVQNRFYVKTVDMSGFTVSFRYFDYNEVFPEKDSIASDGSNYAKKEDIDSLKESVGRLEKMLEDLVK